VLLLGSVSLLLLVSDAGAQKKRVPAEQAPKGLKFHNWHMKIAASCAMAPTNARFAGSAAVNWVRRGWRANHSRG